ncbi:MAG TPA: Ig-like domain-containing protein, partial [Bacilli bacterium]|nr:Ig-like domain-containing protein [Bacilli bacterium]
MKKIVTLLIIFFSVFLLACTKERTITLVGENEVQISATIKLEVEANFKLDSVLTWSSSNEDLATVDGGIVKGRAAGEVVITVSIGDLIAQKIVKVVKPPFEIIISGANKIAVGGQMTLEVTTFPLTEGRATYVSSASEVATVDSAGLVTGLKPGDTNIIVSINGVTANFLLTVYDEEVLEIIID